MRVMRALVLHLGGVGECMRLIWGWSDHGQESGDLHDHHPFSFEFSAEFLSAEFLATFDFGGFEPADNSLFRFGSNTNLTMPPFCSLLRATWVLEIIAIVIFAVAAAVVLIIVVADCTSSLLSPSLLPLCHCRRRRRRPLLLSLLPLPSLLPSPPPLSLSLQLSVYCWLPRCHRHRRHCRFHHFFCCCY